MKHLILICLIYLTISCKKDDASTVKYEISCSPSGFDITYESGSGNTEQQSVSSGSWSKSFTGHKDDFVYVSAQANNENAKVTAKIYYEGKLIETATSNGDYVIATASGTLP